ncbi:MAG: CapA family protein [Patescibacteria group bacterium]
MAKLKHMNRMAKNSFLILAGVVLAALLCFYFLPGNSFVIEGGTNQNGNGAAGGGNGVAKNMEEDGIVAEGDSGKVVLAAVGDIMLARSVERQMIAKGDWKYPFLSTADITSGADIAFGNLETTILPGKTSADNSFFFRTDPKALEGLKFAGFDVLSLANNHMMNFGLEGLQSTLRNLDGAGIGHIGAGISEKEIYAPVIKEVGGVKFGFLAYTYAEERFSENGDAYGTVYADVDKMKKQVAELAKSVDVAVVSMHMGEEYQTQPNAAQKNFARAAVDAGADLVVGHHPHVVETFEKYNGGYIIYSLGNFVFDQMWSEETRLGAIVKVTVENKKISDMEFVPIKIFNYAQPQILEGEEKDMILKRLQGEG